jgi:hypothetical protein
VKLKKRFARRLFHAAHSLTAELLTSVRETTPANYFVSGIARLKVP